MLSSSMKVNVDFEAYAKGKLRKTVQQG